MPSLRDWDSFPYIPQEEDTPACVPACVEMVCEYWGIQKTREQFEQELDYSPDVGTHFENVSALSGVRVIRIRSIAEVHDHLARHRPVIANLRIASAIILGYSAEEPFLHAVVIVALEPDTVVIMDPLSLMQAGTTAPRVCSRDAFESAFRGGSVILPPRP